jgi:hypothetical protein
LFALGLVLLSLNSFYVTPRNGCRAATGLHAVLLCVGARTLLNAKRFAAVIDRAKWVTLFVVSYLQIQMNKLFNFLQRPVSGTDLHPVWILLALSAALDSYIISSNNTQPYIFWLARLSLISFSLLAFLTRVMNRTKSHYLGVTRLFCYMCGFVSSATILFAFISGRVHEISLSPATILVLAAILLLVMLFVDIWSVTKSIRQIL